MIATRNIETKTEYALLAQYKKGKKASTLEQAVDNTVRMVPGGEYLTNVKIYIKNSSYFIVEGDIWGTGDYQDIRLRAKPGMRVTATIGMYGRVTGTILSLDAKQVTFEWIDRHQKRHVSSLNYDNVQLLD